MKILKNISTQSNNTMHKNECLRKINYNSCQKVDLNLGNFLHKTVHIYNYIKSTAVSVHFRTVSDPPFPSFKTYKQTHQNGISQGK